MHRFHLCILLGLILTTTLAASAERPILGLADHDIHHGGVQGAVKAAGDTIYLVGNPANPDHASDTGVLPQASGTFEDAQGQPAWNGWTSRDLTFNGEQYWHISDFRAVSGQFSLWCGDRFDGDPGYGNDWNQEVRFAHEVDDPSEASEVAWSLTIQNDTEPAYDFTWIEYNAGGEWILLGEAMDGDRTVVIDETFTVEPGHYVGAGGNEIQLRIRFTSDGAWSDEDGLWQTDGACQVDDISVVVNGQLVDHEDFEDQVADRWIPYVEPGVGDFAQLYVGLQDLDPCVSNFTAQVAFIDDGVIVPGTGGTPGMTWRYGPGGYIVNNTGGLAGQGFYLNNAITSPPLAWPDGVAGCSLEFGVYRHEEMGSYDAWPGIFYQWYLRTVSTGDPDDLQRTIFVNDVFVQYGGPEYRIHQHVITDLIAPGTTHLDITLRVIEYGYVWGWVGTDGTPAPYFDNVMVRAYPFEGPAISGQAIDWFQDSFPASGTIDLEDLAGNSVRLDMARNIAHPDHLANVPGDSCLFRAVPVRSGSELVEHPRFHVRMKANTLFDPYRTLPDGFTLTSGFFADGASLIEGWVHADSCLNHNQDPPQSVAGTWTVDLPDEHFFYPGDELRWYLEARDRLPGGDTGLTLLPADTTGFADFDPMRRLAYEPDCIVRALPSIHSADGGQPDLLFWNDAQGHTDENKWLLALANLGYLPGRDYDLYTTTAPRTGVGNGLGGRATSAQLAGYDKLLYTCGDLETNLLGNGDFQRDPSNDLAVVTAWLAQGDKNLALTGDNLVSGLLETGPAGTAFVNTFLSVTLVNPSVLDLIGCQTAPRVVAIPGNGVFSQADRWIAYGGCPGINTFDAVECTGPAERLAEFTDFFDDPGAYPYAAAVHTHNVTHDANVIYLPYAFSNIVNTPDWDPPYGVPVPVRAVLLDEIITMFGTGTPPPPIGVDTPAPTLTAGAWPNPFNPRTTIRLDLPQASEVRLRIVNVRGERVRELVDGRLEAGHHQVLWDGRTEQGADAASGVYFYEVKAAGQTALGKMTLVR